MGPAQANACSGRLDPHRHAWSCGASQSKATGVVSGPQEAPVELAARPRPQQSVPGTDGSGALEPQSFHEQNQAGAQLAVAPPCLLAQAVGRNCKSLAALPAGPPLALDTAGCTGQNSGVRCSELRTGASSPSALSFGQKGKSVLLPAEARGLPAEQSHGCLQGPEGTFQRLPLCRCVPCPCVQSAHSLGTTNLFRSWA